MNREYLETLLKDFGQMLTTETVIGEPLTFGKVTIVPVVSVSFAFGSGGGGKSAENEKPSALASTAGAKLTPVAFLSIHEDGTVNLHHVKAKDSYSPVDRLIEMAPSFIDKLSASFSKGKAKPEKKAADPLADFGSDAVSVPGEVSVKSDLPVEVTAALAKVAADKDVEVEDQTDAGQDQKSGIEEA